MFDYLFKDSGTYEIVQPLEEFHMGTGVIQPPVIEIGGSHTRRHPAINYKSFKTHFTFLSFPPWYVLGHFTEAELLLRRETGLKCYYLMSHSCNTRVESMLPYVTNVKFLDC